MRNKLLIKDIENMTKVLMKDLTDFQKCLTLQLTPYQGKILFGKVIATVLRGRFIFKEGMICDKPVGRLLLNENILRTLETQ